MIYDFRFPPRKDSVFSIFNCLVVIQQHPMRYGSVGNQLDRTVIQLQLFRCNQVRFVIMQSPVHASNSLHVGTNSSQIV